MNMMEYEEQLKLQAYLDGELPEAEARQMAQRVAADAEAAALLSELRQTRATMAGFEQELKLPESREFFWSKLRREIDRIDARKDPEPEPSVPWIVLLRRWLVPAAGVALVAFVSLLAVREGSTPNSRPHIETALADSGAVTYHDYNNGATLVWLPYPAENEVADLDDLGTLD